MKTIAVSNADSKLDSLVGSAQKERVLLTRAGKPSALLIGIENYDEEDLALATSANFWRMIEDRRSGKSLPLSEVKARLGLKGAHKRRSKTNGKAKRNRGR
jgi:PHD/YefM family antitoxin component YafN of YafNO toxin-antitoxin module